MEERKKVRKEERQIKISIGIEERKKVREEDRKKRRKREGKKGRQAEKEKERRKERKIGRTEYRYYCSCYIGCYKDTTVHAIQVAVKKLDIKLHFQDSFLFNSWHTKRREKMRERVSNFTAYVDLCGEHG